MGALPNANSYNQTTKQPHQQKHINNDGLMVWNGKYNYWNSYGSGNTTSTFNHYLKNSGFIKNEFETTAESLKRMSDEGYVNKYFGDQVIETKYNADKLEFFVSINKVLTFKVYVPRDTAEYFKNSVRSFDVGFSPNLNIENIQVEFNGKTFYGKDIKKDALIELDRKKAGGVQIGNLYFQDVNLPNTMDWNQACNYCKQLKLGGFSWLLPTIEQLKLVYTNRANFKNYTNNSFWSFTKDKSNTANSKYLYNGSEDSYSQTGKLYVRCMRNA